MSQNACYIYISAKEYDYIISNLILNFYQFKSIT